MSDELRVYGQWAGNPTGIREDVTRCVAEVSDGWIFRQCTRKRGHGPGGLYCKQHGQRAEARLDWVRQRRSGHE